MTNEPPTIELPNGWTWKRTEPYGELCAVHEQTGEEVPIPIDETHVKVLRATCDAFKELNK